MEKGRLVNIFEDTILSSFTTRSGKFSKSDDSNTVFFQIQKFGKNIKENTLASSSAPQICEIKSC